MQFEKNILSFSPNLNFNPLVNTGNVNLLDSKRFPDSTETQLILK